MKLDGVERVEFASARDFLRYLRRSEPHWTPDGSWGGFWIFRGQSDADLPLLPSAWRSVSRTHTIFKGALSAVNEAALADVSHRYIPEFSKCPDRLRQLIAQHVFERSVAGAFGHLTDQLGFSIPGNKVPRPSPITETSDPCGDESPFRDVIALARHHGMPARILDWTYNPLVAACFAADETSCASGEIAVWAANLEGLRGSQLNCFSVPRSQIGYLHAQEALFMRLDAADIAYLQYGAWPCFEWFAPPPSLRKLTLPKSEIYLLRKLLWAERVSKAHLMPSLDNVANTLHEL